ncbi:MAG TPA: cytochrome c [Longimicrobiales bacterium]|nr:cytochrome c [Longimicrobiales bacterium]
MRHILANIMTYAVAVLLFSGAAAFAWMRSAQLTIAGEESIIARYQPAEALTFEWHDLGRASYQRNCMNCHRSDGSGWDQYPPVTNAAEFLASPQGRDYLIDLHVYGLTSSRWRAPMPPMGHILDVELAAVINWIATEFGAAADSDLLVPADVAARRGLGLSPAAVETRRPPVGPTGPR